MAKIDEETLQVIIDILRSPADAINIVKQQQIMVRFQIQQYQLH